MNRPVALFSCIAFLFNTFHCVAQLANNGVIDLSEVSFEERNRLTLNGNWAFEWNRFTAPDSGISACTDQIAVPGNWFNFNPDKSSMHAAYGHGSYALQLKLPQPHTAYALKLPNIHSSYEMFINGTSVGTCGVPSAVKERSVPSSQTRVVSFISDSNAQAVLVFHVSNYFYPSACGIWLPIEIGTVPAITASRSWNYMWSGFLTGSLLLMALYHIGLFVSRRKDVTTLIFATLCLMLAIRELFSGEVIAFDLFPHLPWHAAMRILIAIFPLVLVLFALFIYKLYPNFYNRKVLLALTVYCGIYMLVVLFTPSWVYLGYMMYFNVGALCFGLYSIYVLFRATLKRSEGALLFALGVVVMMSTLLHDIFVQVGLITGTFLVPAAFFFFILMQSLVLAVRFSKSFFRVEELSISLDNTNRAYERFVPKEMLKLLNKEDIIAVKLGDEMRAEMTVLFADIVGFTTIAEKMSDARTFQFINWTLGRTSPIIKENNGFIDKYIGDAIMAVFPNRPDDAVLAAIQMRENLRQGMESDPFGLDVNVDYGIGIHTGNLVLGTVGGEERMEGTVISDAVNTAARIESLTRKYAVGVIISADVKEKLQQPELFEFRFLDETALKGKSKLVRIYEVMLKK